MVHVARLKVRTNSPKKRKSSCVPVNYSFAFRKGKRNRRRLERDKFGQVTSTSPGWKGFTKNDLKKMSLYGFDTLSHGKEGQKARARYNTYYKMTRKLERDFRRSKDYPGHHRAFPFDEGVYAKRRDSERRHNIILEAITGISRHGGDSGYAEYVNDMAKERIAKAEKLRAQREKRRAGKKK